MTRSTIEAVPCATGHDWRWLPRPVVTIGPAGKGNAHYNIKCVRCGARGWGHGDAPNMPTATVIQFPTTGRS